MPTILTTLKQQVGMLSLRPISKCHQQWASLQVTAAPFKPRKRLKNDNSKVPAGAVRFPKLCVSQHYSLLMPSFPRHHLQALFQATL